MNRLLLILTAALALTGNATASVQTTLARITGIDTRCYPAIPGIPAEGQRPNGMYAPADQDTGLPRIYLTDQVCGRIGDDLARRTPTRTIGVTRRGLAWLVVAHEIAHHYGYDHGQTTIGAECAGFRYYLRPLLRAARLQAAYADREIRLVKRTGPCLPWVAASP